MAVAEAKMDTDAVAVGVAVAVGEIVGVALGAAQVALPVPSCVDQDRSTVTADVVHTTVAIPVTAGHAVTVQGPCRVEAAIGAGMVASPVNVHVMELDTFAVAAHDCRRPRPAAPHMDAGSMRRTRWPW